ncbi:two-component sensor histidine kinase [filamentous cyanobacterium CCP1]|nr:two-component sensor histidine kinase [filamentous cyanobacterium CCP2]PSB59970.1 two-component sensor histidine kinase [filamentous cyanobacterium CCP1]
MNWRWRRVFLSAQIRILGWLVLLFLLSIIISIFTIRQILSAQLTERVQRSLEQEIEEVQRLVEGRNPTTGEPFGDDVAAIFDVFLSRSVPEDNEFFITLLNGSIYQTSPIALPEILITHPSFLDTLDLSQPKLGQQSQFGETIIYRVHPIETSGDVQGVFVVAQLLRSQQQEIDQAVIVASKVIGSVLMIALGLAWLAIGRVLSPLKLLTETARSIQDFNQSLTQRIPVRGDDEIAELTATFNQMLDRLQTSFTTQREFINDASHEFQTPITVIQGHLEVLGNSLHHQSDELTDAIELMNDELNRMSRLVDDLLLLARAERPDFLNLELIDVSRLTDELYAKATALAPRQWQIASRAAIRIVADRQRITQAIMNLVQNAVEHTKNGDVIELGSQLIRDEIADEVCFWVRDSGVGIDAVDHRRIMQRFARAANTRRKSKGAGLGLSIVKAIAEAHGGRVSISSKLGKGSQFNVIIPLDPPQEVTVR